ISPTPTDTPTLTITPTSTGTPTLTPTSTVTATATATPALSVASIGLSPTVITGGKPISVTITLNYASPVDTVVELSSSDPAVPVPATVIAPSGSRQVTFSQSTTSVSAITNVTITAALGGQTQIATLAVRPLVVANVQAAPAAVFGGSSST